MTNTLVTPADLADFPGAPFTDAAVDAAAARIRAEAGWHIAPTTAAVETVTVDGTRGSRLVLPSRRVVSVSEVRDVTDPANPVVLTGWRLTSAAILVRSSWPCDDDAVEVDMVHGYDETPAELLPLAATLAQEASVNAAVAEESAGPYGQKYANLTTLTTYTDQSMAALDPYRARTGF